MNPLSLKSFRTVAAPHPRGKSNLRTNPRLVSQLRAAINRGESMEEALDALSIRQPRLRKAYAAAIS